MFKRLYDWTLSLAARPRAAWGLGAVSFAESSFFPVPPDVVLVPMILARPELAWRYALVCTLTSVAGGVLGYAIGALLYESLGQWLIALYGYGERLDDFRRLYAEWGAWIILLKGLTPIPYKLVTIASGFAGYDLAWFVALSVVTRGARFFVIAAILRRFGEPIRAALDRHFTSCSGSPRRSSPASSPQSTCSDAGDRLAMLNLARLPSPRALALAALAAAAATIGGAFVFEYGFGLKPCPLCLQQRLPYYAAMPLLALAALVAPLRPRSAALGLGLAALLFLGGAGLGIYHAGAEWGFWPGPADCGATGGPAAAQVGDFLSQLQTTRVVSCTEAAWRFAGLSLAGWNVLISLGLAALSGLGALKAYRA